MTSRASRCIRDERSRMLASLGDKHVLVLRNHGVAVCERDIPTTFVLLWVVQRAAEIQCQAGQLAAKTSRSAMPSGSSAAADAPDLGAQIQRRAARIRCDGAPHEIVARLTRAALLRLAALLAAAAMAAPAGRRQPRPLRAGGGCAGERPGAGRRAAALERTRWRRRGARPSSSCATHGGSRTCTAAPMPMRYSARCTRRPKMIFARIERNYLVALGRLAQAEGRVRALQRPAPAHVRRYRATRAAVPRQPRVAQVTDGRPGPMG